MWGRVSIHVCCDRGARKGAEKEGSDGGRHEGGDEKEGVTRTGDKGGLITCECGLKGDHL